MHTWKIPQEFINELLIRTNIIDLIRSKISLKKIGKNYQSLCPFHHERTPSFTVNYNKQFYHCFGCQSNGNAIDFLMNYEQLNFLESIEELSILNGLTIPKKKYEKLNNNDFLNKTELYLILKKISNIYKNKLLQKESKIAYQYLIDRGITKEMIEYFSIGFSGNQSNNIFKNYHLLNKNEKNNLILLKMIINNSEGKTYDHFRNRIIFPIRDKHGRINGFGGRVINSKIIPKYLNSPETKIFKKRKQIYGIYELLKKNKKPKKIIIVEGYIDVITLTQFHIDYSVGILGTSITSEQMNFLFRITNNIICCYDGDKAGKIASWKSLEISLPFLQDNKNIKFIFLPNGSDPDSIIKEEGTKNFQKRIDQAVNFSEFLFKKLLKNLDLSSIEGKAHFSSLAIKLINKIPGQLIQIYLRKKLGLKLGIIDIEQINSIINQKNQERNINWNIKQTPMRILIGLLIQNPKLSKLVPLKIISIKSTIPGFNIFLELVTMCKNNPTYNTNQILELYRYNKLINCLKKLTIWDHMITNEKIKNVFLDSLTKIVNQTLEKKHQILVTKERNTGLNFNEKKELWSITIALSKK